MPNQTDACWQPRSHRGAVSPDVAACGAVGRPGGVRRTPPQTVRSVPNSKKSILDLRFDTVGRMCEAPCVATNPPWSSRSANAPGHAASALAGLVAGGARWAAMASAADGQIALTRGDPGGPTRLPASLLPSPWGVRVAGAHDLPADTRAWLVGLGAFGLVAARDVDMVVAWTTREPDAHVAARAAAALVGAWAEDSDGAVARVDTLGRASAGIAHDFNNLLAVVAGNASLALGALESGHRARAALMNVLGGAQRGRELTRRLLAHAAPPGGPPSVLDMDSELRELTTMLESSCPHGVRLTYIASDVPVPVAGDVAALQQLTMNLVLNALEACGARNGGEVRVRASVEDRAAATGDVVVPLIGRTEHGYGRVTVEDDGPGMDRRTRVRAFERHFTTKAAGRGLGLAAVAEIVRAHGGGVRVCSEPGRGTTFDVYLPLAAAADRDGHASPPRPALPGARVRARVLLCDDDPDVLDLGRTILLALGHDVACAAGGAEALAMLAADPSFDLLLLDLVMPPPDGEDVLRAARHARPELPVVILSGTPEAVRWRGLDTVGVAGVLGKPYTIDELRAVLDRALEPRPDARAARSG